MVNPILGFTNKCQRLNHTFMRRADDFMNSKLAKERQNQTGSLNSFNILLKETSLPTKTADSLTFIK